MAYIRVPASERISVMASAILSDSATWSERFPRKTATSKSESAFTSPRDLRTIQHDALKPLPIHIREGGAKPGEDRIVSQVGVVARHGHCLAWPEVAAQIHSCCFTLDPNCNRAIYAVW